MPVASACAVSSPAAASGTCRPPPTTCASYTGSLSAAPDQPRRGTPTATGPSSEPPEAHQGRHPRDAEPLQTTTPDHSATGSPGLFIAAAASWTRRDGGSSRIIAVSWGVSPLVLLFWN